VYGISYFRFKRKITTREILENIGNFQVIRNHPQPAGIGVTRQDVTDVCVGEDEIAVLKSFDGRYNIRAKIK
jgi:hypothetical protein